MSPMIPPKKANEPAPDAVEARVERLPAEGGQVHAGARERSARRTVAMRAGA